MDNNYVETVISLAPNLFFGTTISVSILVLSKNKKDNRFQFIDASSLYIKKINNNELSDSNVNEILKIFDEKNILSTNSALVDHETIVNYNYNLSVNSYVKSKDNREVIDISKINSDIEDIVAKIDLLRKQINSIIADLRGESHERDF